MRRCSPFTCLASSKSGRPSARFTSTRKITRARLMPRPEGRGGIRQSEGASMAASD
jgi:hypothetical protein